MRAPLSRRAVVAVRPHPVRKALEERRCAAGTATKVALTAWRRKVLTILPAMVNHPTPWQPREVSIAYKCPMDP